MHALDFVSPSLALRRELARFFLASPLRSKEVYCGSFEGNVPTKKQPKVVCDFFWFATIG
jgi:hypothetical protein